mgnify:CR=1 FL=1|jgi:hypothetical protein
MKTKELKLTKQEIEKLILLMDDKYSNTGMFYQTKVLYDKLLNSAK